ncbi:MAG: EF-P beta-lysylation protein EpmB [Chromatiales bacterium]|nr:EF-P beta-lysylation protein EpmB [Chromatiales bacterium]
MIPRSDFARQTPDWQHELARSFTSLEALLAYLGLPADALGPVPFDAAGFPLRVPRPFAERMRPGDPDDPLLRQIAASANELVKAPGFGSDPVGDHAARRGYGLLQKYHGRALLIATGACAVHCRYCFRRHFPYAEDALRDRDLDVLLEQLADDDSIDEVILSGGDPLSLRDERLATVVRRIEAIPHLRRLRIHTRVPVVLPQRVDDALVGWLGATRFTVIVVLHINHANEIDAAVIDAANRLAQAGAILLNQSVLLTGVNDSLDALTNLSLRLADARITPYYLHALDRVAGAAHFEVPDERAVQLLNDLRSRLPGYLVPRLVREIAGARSKLPLG